MFQNAEERVPIYVFDPVGSLKWLEAVRAGFVSGGVISHPKGAVVKREAGPPTPEAIFSESYRLVTPENVEKVFSEPVR